MELQRNVRKKFIISLSDRYRSRYVMFLSVATKFSLFSFLSGFAIQDCGSADLDRKKFSRIHSTVVGVILYSNCELNAKISVGLAIRDVGVIFVFYKKIV